MLVYWAFLAGAYLARMVPLRVSYGLARLVGGATYYAWGGGRRRCIQNMRHVTGGDERAARRYARASLANYLVYLVDFFRVIGTNADEIRARVRGDDWERIRDERTGRGIVAMTMHYGNWDLGGAILALHGLSVAAIADRFDNPRVNRYVLGSRQHLGMKIIPADRMGPGLIRALRNNDAVAVLVDIPAPESGIRVTFFGDTIAVPDGPARLALRTGAGIVAGVVVRHARWDDGVRLEAAAITFDRTGDEGVDAQALTQAVFAHFEQFIRRDPSQWYIFRNLWPADARREAETAAMAR
ncbi:MAG: hypothetical protein WC273_04905 [Dehalococcoidia bacterium]